MGSYHEIENFVGKSWCLLSRNARKSGPSSVTASFTVSSSLLPLPPLPWVCRGSISRQELLFQFSPDSPELHLPHLKQF